MRQILRAGDSFEATVRTGRHVVRPAFVPPARGFSTDGHQRKLKIAMVATTGRPVPAPGYGPCELMIDGLARGLVELGHEVCLFAASDSTCPVPRYPDLPASNPHHIDDRMGELQYVLDIYENLDEFDIIHDHTLIGPTYARAFPGHRVVTTNHGLPSIPVFPLIADWVPILAISKTQAAGAPYPVSGIIHHGIDSSSIPVGKGNGQGDGDYLLFMGRMSPDKGVHIAIDVAKRAGRKLIIAGTSTEPSEQRYFNEFVRPALGANAEFIGEVSGDTKFALLGGAGALLNPLQWEEPFGLVMIEAMATGTPVVALAHGAAPEIIDHGRTGFLAKTADEMLDGVKRVDTIDRAGCRKVVEEYFSYHRMAAEHAALFGRLLEDDPWRRSRALRDTINRAARWRKPVIDLRTMGVPVLPPADSIV